MPLNTKKVLGNEKINIILVIFVLICLNALLIYKNSQYYKLITNSSNYKINNEALVKDLFLRDLELLSQDVYITNIDILKSYRDNNTDIQLIYVYSYADCQKCIDEEIEILKNMIGKEYKDYLLILPALSDSRQNKIKLKYSLSTFKYNIIRSGTICFPTDENGKPARFFAILNEEGLLKDVYFPTVKDLSRTEYYIDYVKSKYF